MSINFDARKIGDWIKKYQADIAIVAGFILVAAIAFGAGRLSAPQIVRNPIMLDEPNSSSNVNLYANVSQPLAGGVGDPVESPSAITGQGTQKGIFVGSKNSNKYHWPWCAPAKNIKPENQVWFQTESQAQAAGYSPSSCIQSQAPAGYVKQ